MEALSKQPVLEVIMPDPIISKACSSCGIKKTFGEFGVRKSTKDGLRSACKSCEIAASAAYRLAHPEKIVSGRAAYYAANADRIKATFTAYCLAHPEKVKATQSAYYASNAERIKASKSAYRAINAEKIAAARAAKPEIGRVNEGNRRARKLKAGGTLSKGLSEKLFNLQGGKCPCCAQPLGDDYHLDHITPLALGGSNTDGNVQLLRKLCNLQKSAKHPVDFMQSRGFLL